MGSVIDYNVECPQCGFYAMTTDSYYKTGEEADSCGVCGYTLRANLIKDDEGDIHFQNGNFRMEEKEVKGSGVFYQVVLDEDEKPKGGIMHFFPSEEGRLQLLEVIRMPENIKKVGPGSYICHVEDGKIIEDYGHVPRHVYDPEATYDEEENNTEEEEK